MEGLLDQPTCSDSGLIILASAAILAILTGCFLLWLIFKLMNENRSLRQQVGQFQDLQKLMSNPTVSPKTVNSDPSNEVPGNYAALPLQNHRQDGDCNVLKYSIIEGSYAKNNNNDNNNQGQEGNFVYNLATRTITKNDKHHKGPVQVSVPQLPKAVINENPGLEDSFETVKTDKKTETGNLEENNQNYYASPTAAVRPSIMTQHSHTYDQVPEEVRLNFSTAEDEVTYANVLAPGTQPIRNARSLRKKRFWQRF